MIVDTRRHDRGRKRSVWLSPYLLAVVLSPVVLQSSTPLSCNKTGETTLSSLELEVSNAQRIAFDAAQRSYDVWLPVSADAAIMRTASTDPAAEVIYRLSVGGEATGGAWIGVGGGEVAFNLPVGRSELTVSVKAPGGASDSYSLNVNVGCSQCDDNDYCTRDTCDLGLEICVHRPLANGSVCSLNGPVGLVWTDSIQSGSWPYGFDEFLTERPIGNVVTPSDANGANLSRVLDPLGGAGYAIRQYGVFDRGGARAELGIWSFQQAEFGALALSGAPVYVAQEWYFPETIDAGSDAWPWLAFLDWQTMETGGNNRWHTSPGLVLNQDGSMTFELNWGDGPAQFNGDGSGWSSIGMPVGEWFDVEVRWQFATGPTATVSAWINGQLAVEQIGVVTALPQHTVVEFYVKHYGDDQGRTPWNPRNTIKYVRNVRISGARIWQ